MSEENTLILSNNEDIPILGLGTYQLRGKKGEDIMVYALNNGYKHIDTAAMYRNEREVAQAIERSYRTRKDIWITTKVWTSELGYAKTKRALQDSLQNLGTDYVDLYLIHWPGSSALNRKESWRLMLEMRDQERIRTPGVSNFSISQLIEIYDEFGLYPPVNQVNFSPFHHKPDLLEFCKENNIVVTAYSPLNKGNGMDHPVIKKLSSKYDKTPAQIMLRWAVDKGLVVIPKTSRSDRVDENRAIFDFDLEKEDITEIDEVN